MKADITMKASLPNKDLITKDLTASQIKAWANPQFLYYNTFQMHHVTCGYATDNKSRIKR
ncbi:hypothetical protein HMPREF1415_00112 [Helicobacter pylori GAM254Ai]|nr:hypothetical protein HMPREF1415_00112 [Helicobacter pylori GAM254Ai]